jgi:hypothetical protein
MPTWLCRFRGPCTERKYSASCSHPQYATRLLRAEVVRTDSTPFATITQKSRVFTEIAGLSFEVPHADGVDALIPENRISTGLPRTKGYNSSTPNLAAVKAAELRQVIVRTQEAKLRLAALVAAPVPQPCRRGRFDTELSSEAQSLSVLLRPESALCKKFPNRNAIATEVSQK